MKLYEVTIGETESTGVNIISLVNDPAIEELFVKMSKVHDTSNIQLMSNDKQIVIGPVLIPDKPIYRQKYHNGILEEFNIVFRKDTIEKISERFINSDSINNVDIEHNEIILNKVNIVSSYILSDELKDERFSHLPNGTWIVAYKINDKNIWDNQIKAGKINGFSIDGFFNMNSVKLQNDMDINVLINNILNII